MKRESEKHEKGSFETTRWTLVCAAGGASTTESRRALEELCRMYWYPLYCYIRRRDYSHADAEDLVQGFFVHIFDRNLFALADRTKGRLRGLLLSSLQFYVADERKHQAAAKRGGGATILPLDTADAEARYAGEPADIESPDVLFERRWALTVLERAISMMSNAWDQAGKRRIFEGLRPYILARLDGTEARRLGEQLGMTEIHVKVSLHRLREQFGDALRREVADTVTSKDEVDAEMAILRAAVG